MERIFKFAGDNGLLVAFVFVGAIMVLVVLVLGVALLTTDFYSDRLSGSKRTFFIVLLFAYAVYRSFRTYSLLKTRKTNEE